MTDSDEHPSLGVFASVRRTLQLSLEAVRIRAELFSIELREETHRLVKTFVLVSVFLFFAAAGTLLTSFTLLLLFWDDPRSRLISLSILSLLYLIGAAIAGRLLWRRLTLPRLPFADSLGELEKDRKSFGSNGERR